MRSAKCGIILDLKTSKDIKHSLFLYLRDKKYINLKYIILYYQKNIQ